MTIRFKFDDFCEAFSYSLLEIYSSHIIVSWKIIVEYVEDRYVEIETFSLNPQCGYLKIDAYLLNLVSHDF